MIDTCVDIIQNSALQCENFAEISFIKYNKLR